jgi:hypothetical protein
MCEWLYCMLEHILLDLCLGVVSWTLWRFYQFLRDLHIAIHSGCTNLHSYQQCMSVIFPTSSPALLFVLLMTAILTGVSFCMHFIYDWGGLAFLHMFIGHLYFCFWELSVHLFHELLILWEVSFLSSLYFLVMNALSDVQLAKILFHYVGCLFSLVIVSFVIQKLFSFMAHLSILPLDYWSIGVPFIKLLPMPMWSNVFLFFPGLISLFLILH